VNIFTEEKSHKCNLENLKNGRKFLAQTNNERREKVSPLQLFPVTLVLALIRVLSKSIEGFKIKIIEEKHVTLWSLL
jgi:hypothetical protein